MAGKEMFSEVVEEEAVRRPCPIHTVSLLEQAASERK